MTKKTKTKYIMADLQNEKKEPIVIDNSSNVIGWLERMTKLVKEYGITKILISAILVAFLSLVFWFLFNPTKAFEIYEDWKQRQHEALMELRMETAPKIQTSLDKLTYKVDASRSVILELHNGTSNNGGIPFTKCSATYEALNIGVPPIASEYQEQNLSLIPFAHFLFERGYWCGNTDELMEIDRALCYKLKSNKTEHFAACVIEGIDKPLAFMIVSFEAPLSESHKCDEVRENIRHITMELAVYFEVEKRIGEHKKNKESFFRRKTE
jgi:hypothetical protein